MPYANNKGAVQPAHVEQAGLSVTLGQSLKDRFTRDVAHMFNNIY